MKYLILALPALFLAGCGNISRAEYEKANPLPFSTEYVVAESDDTRKSGLQAGDVIVVRGPDFDPRIDPVSGDYTCKRGNRVAVYRDGIMIRRWFEDLSVLKEEK